MYMIFYMPVNTSNNFIKQIMRDKDKLKSVLASRDNNVWTYVCKSDN